MIKTEPATLLMKKRGYLETLFQKSFIIQIHNIHYFLIQVYLTFTNFTYEDYKVINKFF